MNINNMFASNLLISQVFWMSLAFSVILLYMHYIFVPKAEINASSKEKHMMDLETELKLFKQEIHNIETEYLAKKDMFDNEMNAHIAELYEKYNVKTLETMLEIENKILSTRQQLQQQFHDNIAELYSSLDDKLDEIIHIYENNCK